MPGSLGRSTHDDLVRRYEAGCLAAHDRHAVALHVAIDLRDLLLGDDADAPHELAQARVAIHVERHAVQTPPLEPREVERGLAQRLRGQRARVHARAAQRGRLLDERDALAEIRRLRRALLARRARADDDEVELRRVGAHDTLLTTPFGA